MRLRSRIAAIAAPAMLVAGVLTGVPATASVAAPTGGHVVAGAKVFANCTALNKVYPHGVAKKGARDRVSGSSKPVKNFKVDTAVYKANAKKDRDKDGVACEKR